MRFKGFDLNLLVALDHLLTERSVSRAADRLGRNQSTVSGILSRLRAHFQDDLLVQVGREMVPTARGVELAATVRDLLLQVDASVMTAPAFDPASCDRTITVFASDYLMIAGLAEALRTIHTRAPALKFIVMQPSQFQRGKDAPSILLEKGEIDLLAMPQDFMSPDHPRMTLFTETFCCLVWQHNSRVGARISFDDFLQMRHITVGFGAGALPSYEEWFNRTHGETLRSIDAVAASFATMPFLVTGTDRIALAHRRLADVFARILPLRIVEAPFSIPPLIQGLQWNQYTSTDRALMWVRDQIALAMHEGEAADPSAGA